MDFEPHHAAIRAAEGSINTLTLDPGANYMTPTFWDDIPVLVNGLTAFLCSEENECAVQRPHRFVEMAETLAGYGCEIIAIARKPGAVPV